MGSPLSSSSSPSTLVPIFMCRPLLLVSLLVLPHQWNCFGLYMIRPLGLDDLVSMREMAMMAASQRQTDERQLAQRWLALREELTGKGQQQQANQLMEAKREEEETDDERWRRMNK